MTDISKCRGELDGVVCPLRERCVRWTAIPDAHWQSMVMPTEIGDKCRLWIPDNWNDNP